MSTRQVITLQDFDEITALGWSGCMHDSDCACTLATFARDNRVLAKWAAAKDAEDLRG